MTQQKKICKMQGCAEEMYSETLTRGFCLNCYHDVERDRREMEIEDAHDRVQGLTSDFSSSFSAFLIND